MRTRDLLCLAIGVVMSGRAAAQGADASSSRSDSSAARFACPRAGAAVSAWTNFDDSSSVRPLSAVPAARRHSALDTTFVLAIADRGWRRDSLDAGAAIGASGGSATRGQWHTCAGASVHLGRVEARLRNISGRVHLRASAGALDSIGRSPSGSSPAVPPRR
jgi:hypothetical protein